MILQTLLALMTPTQKLSPSQTLKIHFYNGLDLTIYLSLFTILSRLQLLFELYVVFFYLFLYVEFCGIIFFSSEFRIMYNSQM